MLPYIKSGQAARPRDQLDEAVAAAPDIPSYGEQGYPTLDFICGTA